MYAARVFDSLNEKSLFGLAAVKLNVGEQPPKESDVDEAEFAFRLSAGCSKSSGDWFGGKSSGAFGVVFIHRPLKIHVDAVLAGIFVEI